MIPHSPEVESLNVPGGEYIHHGDTEKARKGKRRHLALTQVMIRIRRKWNHSTWPGGEYIHHGDTEKARKGKERHLALTQVMIPHSPEVESLNVAWRRVHPPRRHGDTEKARKGKRKAPCAYSG
jgi:hypothetical protein